MRRHFHYYRLEQNSADVFYQNSGWRVGIKT
jgi:hypothetical protein